MYDNGLGKYLLNIISLHLFAVTFMVVFCSNGNATTYYVCGVGTSCGTGWSTGNNSNACTSKSSPCFTITGGVGKMSGGDTLIIGNGTYTSNINNPPSGSTGAYTTIQAENDFGVLIDGSGFANNYNHGINVGTNYVKIRGIKVKMNQSNGTNLPVQVAYGNHVKLIRIGAGYGPTSGNAATFTIGPSTDYVTVEECYAYGGARYQFLTFWANHTIFRRNVGRVDYWHNAGLQCAVYCNYDAVNTVWQNNIAIDTPASNCTNLSNISMLYGGFYWENKSDHAADTTNILEGNIILNVEHGMYAAGAFDRLSGTHKISNHIMYGGNSGFLAEPGPSEETADHIAYFNHFTVGGLSGYNYDGINGLEAGGTGVAQNVNIAGQHISNNYVKNSILFNNQSYGIADYTVSDYNMFYGNARGNVGGSLNTPTIGTHSVTGINPLTNGLLYLPRVESGSYLKTAGEGGGQIGAEVMYQQGVSGTLYGDTGYNDLTSIPLWPFPNETQIKADLAAYSGPGSSGARGFAASGKQLNGVDDITLTSYIWEYLGNQMPADIYASSPVNGVCGTNNGGAFTSLASSDANNCSSGTVTNFSGTGPWTWYCAGSGGGTNSGTCSASLSASLPSDTTAPSVSITTASPQSITTNSLTVIGSASDAAGVTSCKYRIGAAPNASNGTACTGTTSWSCSTSGYSSGSNTLYVGCSDGAGNWPSSPPSITVNYTLPTTSCTYYVRPDGHNTASGSNNTNNASTGAWLTLQYAANMVVAGNTVCVADGTYAGFMIQTAGTSGSPITFKALGTGANITSRNPTTTDGINLEDWGGGVASYITIDGFNVSGATRMGIRAINGLGIIIQNNTVHNNADCGIFSGNTPGIQVLNNTLYSNGSTVNQHNIYISNAESDNAIVRGNKSYSAGGGNGIQFNGDYTAGGDGFIDNVLVENNILYNNAGNGIKLISCRYATVRNNITYGHAGAGGVHIADQYGSHYSINNVVVNNTLDETGVACARINANQTGNILFNNICIGSTGIVFEGSGNYQSNNYRATTGGSSIFTAYSNHDYTLLSTSPTKDYGITSYQSKSAPTVDFLGNTRPSGAGYDAGAYEFGSLLGTVNTLSILNVSPD